MSVHTAKLKETLLTVFVLEKTETYCDDCPRTAKYSIFVNGVEQYCCTRHAVNALNATIKKIDGVRVGA